MRYIRTRNERCELISCDSLTNSYASATATMTGHGRSVHMFGSTHTFVSRRSSPRYQSQYRSTLAGDCTIPQIPQKSTCCTWLWPYCYQNLPHVQNELRNTMSSPSPIAPNWSIGHFQATTQSRRSWGTLQIADSLLLFLRC